jgi:serine/threonine protein kinase
VVEVDRVTGEDLGTYVAKVVHEGEIGTRALMSYRLVKSHLSRHPGLSMIFEVAGGWQENGFVALMTWVEGSPLAEFIGVFPLLAEDLQEPTTTDLAIRWLRAACEALDVLHRNGLIHGDVSPRNLIVSGGDLVLTDYDFVTRIGDSPAALGTILYSPPSGKERRPASPADDFYALAASFFHVLYDREPFRHGGDLDKQRGLNWDGLDRTETQELCEFFDRATHPDPQQRFHSVADSLACLDQARQSEATERPEVEKPLPNAVDLRTGVTAQALQEGRIEWLRHLLQSYPGSRWGNQETRGLDTPFSESTYVETRLEEVLLRDIRERHVRLVILCGNAGDGKTALLQHLARRLGLGKQPSAHRILEGRLEDGLRVRMNLDGSAAWRGRSADALLDEFLGPFHDGPPAKDIVHVLAINDGKLLEWVNSYAERHEGQTTALTDLLAELLEGDSASPDSHVQFISLNRRSLVGDVSPDRQAITTDFLDRLVDHLFGGENARTIWRPCELCSAKVRCEVYRAVRRFGPDSIPFADEKELRRRARERLFELLQAVHLRGETHITVRELRATLVYILFGMHHCDDYHAGAEEGIVPYWDHAFESRSSARQGEVLRELARFDPAWDAHPQIDRHLATHPIDDSPGTAPRFPELSLESARRRAFFEWTRENIAQVAGDEEAYVLARGRHLWKFRCLPMMDAEVRDELCSQICGGISRLEDLPPKALERSGVVPLRVTPRTPTETAFWVEKLLTSFRLEPDLPVASEGIERLHRQAVLIYRYRDGQEERLRLGAELFHLLLELNEGYQLGDVSSDDTFANLSIFIQRLVQEDSRELFAWNPMADEAIYRIAAEYRDSGEGRRQYLSLEPLAAGDQR